MKDEKDGGDSKSLTIDSASANIDSSPSLIPHPSSFATGRAFLDHLLSARNQHPERAAEIDERLRQVFERRVAILALDMAGFSRLTIQHGIIHYLAMIHQMQQAARPAVTGNHGKVVKFEADNLFAIFDDPVRALEGALDIFRAFDAINNVLPRQRSIYGSIGIGYGETIIIDNEDLFGSEMNVACKLGEDLAGHGEILLTQAAFNALPFGRYSCSPVRSFISEMEIDYYRYEGIVYSQDQEY